MDPKETPGDGGQQPANPPAPEAPADSSKETPAGGSAEQKPVTPAGDAGAQDGDGKPAGDAPAASTVPEKYELTFSEDSLLGDDARERLATTAKELKLPKEAAQKVAQLVDSEVAQQAAALLAAHQPGGAVWTEKVDAWKAETLSDPKLGKTEEERTASIQAGQSVVLEYSKQNPDDADAFKEFMNVSGLGDHPVTARFLAWIGKQMADGPMHVGRSEHTADSDEAKLARLYPSMAQK